MVAIREDVYEVEELLKNRVVRGKEQYLVKWKGFSVVVTPPLTYSLDRLDRLNSPKFLFVFLNFFFQAI